MKRIVSSVALAGGGRTGRELRKAGDERQHYLGLFRTRRCHISGRVIQEKYLMQETCPVRTKLSLRPRTLLCRKRD